MNKECLKECWSKKYVKIGVAIVAAFFILAALQPSHYRVERSLIIPANRGIIYAQVNNLRHWENWSPWAKLDPTAKMTYEGPRRGKGAIMRWDGNSSVGAGSMTITDSVPNQKVTYALAFLRPMSDEAISEITLDLVPGGTRVTWSMYGKRGFFGKVIGLIINCDKMIGDQYEKGLANLKDVVRGKSQSQDDADKDDASMPSSKIPSAEPIP